ncbi:MAG: phenylacetate--CoA ligase family protein [Thermodesulfobacteriota bacterium]
MNATENSQLLDHLHFVRENSPFFRDLWSRLPEEFSLEDLPLTDHHAYWKENTPVDSRVLTGPHENGVVFKSGGTSGSPKFSFFSNNDWQLFCHAFGEGLRRGGMQPGEKVANLFYGGQLYASLFFIMRSIEEAGVGVCYPIAGFAPPDEISETLQQFRIQTLAGVPTTIMSLLPALGGMGTEKLHVRRIIYGGETMYPDQIEAIKRVLPNVEIRSVGIAGVDYGEMGFAGPDCAPGEHRCLDKSTRLELLNDEGHRIEETGTAGHLYITNFRRRLMPIIRYPVGDRGIWLEPHGSPDRKFQVLGRTDLGARIGPMTLYIEDIQKILAELPDKANILAIQLVVDHFKRKDLCTLRLAVADPAEESQDMTKRLIKGIYRQRHMFPQLIENGIVHPLKLEWVKQDKLHRSPRTGKLLWVLDRRHEDATK